MNRGRVRMSARDWRAAGGLRNPRLFRVQSPGGRWRYYRAT